MRKLLSYLKQPFPVYEGKRWHIVLIVSFVVFAVLAVLQPFDISRIENNKLLIVGGFSLVSGLGMAVVAYVVPFLWPSWHKEWTVWKNVLNLLLVVFVITFGNALYVYLLYSPAASFGVLLSIFLKFTISLAIVPIAIITFFEQNRALKRNLEEARELNRSLLMRTPEPSPAAYVGDPVLLEGNTKDSLELYPQDILYIEASGNYVNV